MERLINLMAEREAAERRRMERAVDSCARNLLKRVPGGADRDEIRRAAARACYHVSAASVIARAVEIQEERRTRMAKPPNARARYTAEDRTRVDDFIEEALAERQMSAGECYRRYEVFRHDARNLGDVDPPPPVKKSTFETWFYSVRGRLWSERLAEHASTVPAGPKPAPPVSETVSALDDGQSVSLWGPDGAFLMAEPTGKAADGSSLWAVSMKVDGIRRYDLENLIKHLMNQIVEEVGV